MINIQIKGSRLFFQDEDLGEFKDFPSLFSELKTRIESSESYDLLDGSGRVVSCDYGDKFLLSAGHTGMPDLWQRQNGLIPSTVHHPILVDAPTMIIAVGSIDGILTTSALLCGIGAVRAQSINALFTQAFKVNEVNLILPPQRIALVDLAVNNRDEQMTIDFVRHLMDGGHEIVAVIDEHDAAAWRRVFEACNLDFEGLLIKPVSQNDCDIKSSGELLRREFDRFGYPYDYLCAELCRNADAADQMDFTGRFASIANKAVKSNIADDARRVALIWQFACGGERISEEIQGWMVEYDAVLETHKAIMDDLQIISAEMMCRISTVGKTVDMTTLMKEAYESYDFVVVDGESFSLKYGGKIRQISIGVNPGLDFNVLQCLQNAGIEASGFASKANLEPENEFKAMQTILYAFNKKAEACVIWNLGILLFLTKSVTSEAFSVFMSINSQT